MPARITELRNALKQRIDSIWLDRWSADDEVIAEYAFDIDSKNLAGRKIYVVPTAEADAPNTRGEDQTDLTLMVMTVERFAKDEGQGKPPEDWVDERVLFTEWLYKKLSNPRRANILAGETDPDEEGFWPELSELRTVYDHDELSERRLFISVIILTYREQSPSSED